MLAVAPSGDRIDQILRRPGRLDYEIEVMIPSRTERADMLCQMCNLSREDAECLAVITPGFVPADL